MSFIYKIRSKVSHSLLAVALSIPLQNQNSWKLESYSKIPANEVNFSQAGLLIKVKSSASPLFYLLPSGKMIYGFEIRGEFRGLPQLSDLTKQGEKNFDDFPLRIGFIVPGKKTLPFYKKLVAAEWVKRLYDNLPDETGIDHVQFFNVTQNEAKVGIERIHPNSDLIHEKFFDAVSMSGPFQYKVKFDKPVKTLALWISIDGDDTKSTYGVLISKLILEIAE